MVGEEVLAALAAMEEDFLQVMVQEEEDVSVVYLVVHSVIHHHLKRCHRHLKEKELRTITTASVMTYSAVGRVGMAKRRRQHQRNISKRRRYRTHYHLHSSSRTRIRTRRL